MDAIATNDTYRFGSFRLQVRGTGLSLLDKDGAWKQCAIGSRARDLLLLMLRRHGEVLPRDEIMDAVWPGVVVEESNLTVQIAALRRVLDQVRPGSSCIQTIPSRGYRFLPTVTREVAGAPIVAPSTATCAVVPDPRPRLSVIVFPFRFLGGDADTHDLANTIADDIIGELSRLPGAFVIAHPSASHLNYAIQGSVQGIANGTRVNVQLIDVETDAHLGGERFDVDRAGNIQVRDEIAGRLVRSLTVKLFEQVNRRIEAMPREDWTVEDLVLHGRALTSRPLSAANRYEALSCFEQALARDPDCVGAKLSVAAVLVANVGEGWSRSAEDDKVRAEQLLLDILRDDVDLPDGHVYLGLLRRLQGRLADARIELEIAIALAPNNVVGIAQLGATLMYLGQPEAATPHIEKSIRLAPHDRGTPVSHSFLGMCHMMLGRAEEAIICLRTARAQNPRLDYVHMMLAAALGLGGYLEEARAALRQAIEIQPEIGSWTGIRGRWEKRSSPQFHALCENTFAIGLQRAGLPQNHVHSVAPADT